MSKLNLFVISELCIVQFYHLIQYVMHILYWIIQSSVSFYIKLIALVLSNGIIWKLVLYN